MKVIVLVGTSGTGKSYQAIHMAKEKGISYIIDDGLLIKGNKVLAGSSAKREKTRMGAIKRALFIDDAHKAQVMEAIDAERPPKILIIGTSKKMVAAIAKTLELGTIDEWVYIEEISSQEEVKTAQHIRKSEGKHVIPVPTFEIKQDFSGYFLNPLRVFKKFGKGGAHEPAEKSVVRPTFSYMGKYTISNRVIRDLIYYAANKVIGIYKVDNIDITNRTSGLIIDMNVEVVYGNPIRPLIECLQNQVIYEIEEMTSFNIMAVDVNVKNLIIS